MRRETERFEDGRQTVRCFNEHDQLLRIESLDEQGSLKVSTDYLYNEAGLNIERLVCDAAGTVLRRIAFDEHGREVDAESGGQVRWRSLDGTEGGVAEKGQEKVGD